VPSGHPGAGLLAVVHDDIFPYVFLTGLALAALGWVALLVTAFRVRVWWGLGVTVFPPTGLAFVVKHARKSAIPLGLLALGAVLAAGPTLYVRLLPIDLGPRERVVGGETHLTLTGWDRKDYSMLSRKPEVVVLQMANPDVTDATLSHLTRMTRLRELDLNGTQITDLGLEALRGLPALQTLRLRDTGVTDAGFRDSLAGMGALRQLDLRGTKVTREAVQAWRDAAPGRKVMQ
jgi:Leucine rich repeat